MRWRTSATMVALVSAIVLPSVAAAQEGVVAGTVAAAAPGPCLVIEAEGINFGAVPFSSDRGNVLEYATVIGTGLETYAIVSCSSETQEFRVGATDAANGDASVIWALRSGNLGQLMCDSYNPNEFWLGIGGEDPGAPGSFLEAFLFPSFDIGVPNASGVNAVAAGDARTVRNRIGMPCDMSDGLGEIFELSILYTAVTVSR